MLQKELIKQYPELEQFQEEWVDISENGLCATLDGNFSAAQLKIIIEVMEKIHTSQELEYECKFINIKRYGLKTCHLNRNDNGSVWLSLTGKDVFNIEVGDKIYLNVRVLKNGLPKTKTD
jgi:hypothetical protein